MIITLPLDIEQALVERAERLGTAPQELELQALRWQFVRLMQMEHPSEAAGTLADFLGDFIGSIQSRKYVPVGARLSERTKEALGNVNVHKGRQGCE